MNEPFDIDSIKAQIRIHKTNRAAEKETEQLWANLLDVQIKAANAIELNNKNIAHQRIYDNDAIMRRQIRECLRDHLDYASI